MPARYYPEPEVEVWEENWRAVDLYRRVSTQWRVGAAGAVGLDYGVVHRELARMQVAGNEFEEEMARIGVIESEMLNHWHKEQT
jgi:hypothetical protein